MDSEWKDSGVLKRTEVLQESNRKLIELSEEDALALINLGRELVSQKRNFVGLEQSEDGIPEERSVIRCVKEAGRDLWSVTVYDAVGAISVPGIELLILPKIPLNHFVHLVSNSSYEFRLHNNEIALESQDSFLDLIASWYLSSLEKAVKSGLKAEYILTEEDRSTISGRVMVRESLSNWHLGRLQMRCKTENLELDSPANRTLLYATKLIISSPIISHSVRNRARRLAERMNGVGHFGFADLNYEVRDMWRIYHSALKLARQLILGCGRSISFGSSSSYSFLIRTPEIIEDSLREILGRRAAELIRVKPGPVTLRLNPSYLSFTPDVVIDLKLNRPGQSAKFIFRNLIVTGDVKYQLNQGEWNRAHLYQAITFASAFNAVGGLVLGFGNQLPPNQQVLEIGGKTFSQINWPISDDYSPGMSEDFLVSKVENWIISLLKPINSPSASTAGMERENHMSSFPSLNMAKSGISSSAISN